MRHKHTAADLARLYDAEPTDTVQTLLWEIARLRSVIKRAHTVRTMVGDDPPAGVSAMVWGILCSELDSEPCIVDPPTERRQRRTAQAVQRMRDGK